MIRAIKMRMLVRITMHIIIIFPQLRNSGIVKEGWRITWRNIVSMTIKMVRIVKYMMVIIPLLRNSVIT